jgi:hypothetical protein
VPASGSYPLKDIIKVMRVGSSSTGSVAAKRLYEGLRKNGKLKKQVDVLKRRLFTS